MYTCTHVCAVDGIADQASKTQQLLVESHKRCEAMSSAHELMMCKDEMQTLQESHRKLDQQLASLAITSKIHHSYIAKMKGAMSKKVAVRKFRLLIVESHSQPKLFHAWKSWWLESKQMRLVTATQVGSVVR